MSIEYTTTVTETAAHTMVYDADGTGYRFEAASGAPDFTLLDTVEESLRESLASGKAVDTREVVQGLVAKARRDVMGELLIKLLCLLSESDSIALDLEVLISASGMPIRDEPDAAIAEKFGVSRQVFSARKKSLMKRLGLTTPPHSKSASAVNTYKKTNRTNYTIND